MKKFMIEDSDMLEAGKTRLFFYDVDDSDIERIFDDALIPYEPIDEGQYLINSEDIGKAKTLFISKGCVEKPFTG